MAEVSQALNLLGTAWFEKSFQAHMAQSAYHEKITEKLLNESHVVYSSHHPSPLGPCWQNQAGTTAWCSFTKLHTHHTVIYEA